MGRMAARLSLSDRLMGMWRSTWRDATCTVPFSPACVSGHERRRRRRSGAGYLAFLVRLDDVALLEILEVREADAALEAGLYLADVVLEPLQRRDRAGPDDHAVAEEPALAPTGDGAVAHVATG